MLAHSTHAFAAASAGVEAALSPQNPSSSALAARGSPLLSADQASTAQTAPPEVPLRPTTR